MLKPFFITLIALLFLCTATSAVNATVSKYTFRFDDPDGNSFKLDCNITVSKDTGRIESITLGQAVRLVIEEHDTNTNGEPDPYANLSLEYFRPDFLVGEITLDALNQLLSGNTEMVLQHPIQVNQFISSFNLYSEGINFNSTLEQAFSGFKAHGFPDIAGREYAVYGLIHGVQSDLAPDPPAIIDLNCLEHEMTSQQIYGFSGNNAETDSGINSACASSDEKAVCKRDTLPNEDPFSFTLNLGENHSVTLACHNDQTRQTCRNPLPENQPVLLQRELPVKFPVGTEIKNSYDDAQHSFVIECGTNEIRIYVRGKTLIKITMSYKIETKGLFTMTLQKRDDDPDDDNHRPTGGAGAGLVYHTANPENLSHNNHWFDNIWKMESAMTKLTIPLKYMHFLFF
ncbi:hypothetical protein ACH42_05490 [Endozoicomonas sp. (ex Bugula neritina AB1)]|nr:hypothetical protein ACH42_05490 [Endozoicomonas sp. (ex Bugula neritina AB1)]